MAVLVLDHVKGRFNGCDVHNDQSKDEDSSVTELTPHLRHDELSPNIGSENYRSSKDVRSKFSEGKLTYIIKKPPGRPTKHFGPCTAEGVSLTKLRTFTNEIRQIQPFDWLELACTVHAPAANLIVIGWS
jgi:hypothetical protein